MIKVYWSAAAAITKYWGLNNRYLCLTVLEGGSLRSGCQHGWVLAEGSVPRLTDCCLLAMCRHSAERG